MICPFVFLFLKQHLNQVITQPTVSIEAFRRKSEVRIGHGFLLVIQSDVCCIEFRIIS